MRFLAILLISLLLCELASSQVIKVVPTPQFPTIQSAINKVNNGDTVLVGAGTYLENLVFPAKDFKLIGAGIGQSIIDGNQTGACLAFRLAASNAMEVRGFTLTNGSGELTPLGASFEHMGGGIYIRSAGSGLPPIEPVFSDIEIAFCSAASSSAIYLDFAGNVKFTRCDIHSNVATNPLATRATIGCIGGLSNPTFKDCRFANHHTPLGSLIVIETPSSFISCTFENSSAQGVAGINSIVTAGSINPVYLIVKNCKFIGLTTTSATSTCLWAANFVNTVIENCLFAKSSGGAIMVQAGVGNRTIRNCTFVDNQTNNVPSGVVAFGASNIPGTDNLIVENCIFANNTKAAGGVEEPFVSPAATTITVFNSITETPANSATITLPVFVDPSNDDYHLAPGSVGINGGDYTNLMPPAVNPSTILDLDGNPRVQFGTVDMGCYEAGHISYDDSAAGRVGETMGGPFDVLQVNGSAGDVFRTVTIPLGTSSNISMVQPPNLANPAGFAIFGLLGEATEASITNVPLGIGNMTFTPCPLVPGHPALFTLTNNLGTFCPQLLPSGPTMWTSPAFPPIFFPLTLTFQGVIEEAPGVYVPTNMVIYKTE